MSDQAATVQYLDPNKPLPEEQNLRWKGLKSIFKKQEKIPKSSIPLTQRNLEEFFNPDYSDEHHAFHPVQGPRKVSVSEWIQLLP
jgi:hypothetical protein